MPTITFDDYILIVKSSIKETSVDNYLPSSCIVKNGKVTLSVLDKASTDQNSESDEFVAKDWAANLMNKCDYLYLSYRSKVDQITIIEIREFQVTKKSIINYIQ